jgi:hypothetical protein
MNDATDLDYIDLKQPLLIGAFVTTNNRCSLIKAECWKKSSHALGTSVRCLLPGQSHSNRSLSDLANTWLDKSHKLGISKEHHSERDGSCKSGQRTTHIIYG